MAAKRTRGTRVRSVKPAPDLASPALDALYGLEPVFAPEAAAGTDALMQFVLLSCPYCGEQFDTRIDLTNGSCVYVEDCQICCQPMEIMIEVNEAGLQSVTSRRLD